MKILENVTIYQCDHCNKRYFRKCDIVKHEKWCKKNPVNQHKCFEFCIHLIQDREPIDGSGDYWTPDSTRRTFQCGITKKFMYSFHAERRKLLGNLSDVERMPLKCDLYKDRMVQELESALD